MTVLVETARSGPYTGDGTTTPLDYDFKVSDETHIVVTETVIATGVDTVKTLTTDYTVTGVGDDGGGTVVPVSNVETTVRWTISRSVPRSQATDLRNLTTLQPEVVETALDKLTQILQDIQVLQDLGVRLPISTSLSELILPSPEAGKSLTWNIAEDGLENTPVVLPSDVTVPAVWQTLIEDNSTLVAIRSGLGLPEGKYDATADPTTGDDTGDGYSVGSLWINTSTDEAFICADATAAAAVWLRVGAGEAMFSDTTAALSVGFTNTTYDHGTMTSGGTSSINLAFSDGQSQKTTMQGSGTLTVNAPSTGDGWLALAITIDTTGGTPTPAFGNFTTEISGTMDTTNGAVNLLRVVRIDGRDAYEIVQM